MEKLFYMAVVLLGSCSEFIRCFFIATAMAIEYLLKFVFIRIAERIIQVVTGLVQTNTVVLINYVPIKIS